MKKKQKGAINQNGPKQLLIFRDASSDQRTYNLPYGRQIILIHWATITIFFTGNNERILQEYL